MVKRTIYVLALCAVGVASHAQTLTGNLLLRQAGTVVDTNFVDQEFPDFASFSTGVGSSFTVTGPGWNINEIQKAYVAQANSFFTNVTSARLTVSRLSGALPSSNHNPIAVSTGSDIVFSGTTGITWDSTAPAGGLFAGRLRANTAGIGALQGLVAGNYVVSLTPVAAFGTEGQAFLRFTASGGGNTFARNPGSGFSLAAGGNWGTIATQQPSLANLDGSIGINGEPVPEPGTMAALALGGLLLARRRRAAKKS